MNRGVYPLLIAQFLTAFADNAILFTAIAMILKLSEPPQWYVPALQSVFLLAFVVLAPWVGVFADKHSKPRVLITGNLIKALGAVAILFGIEPLLAYAVIGVGAAVYSPAKYGILPELVDSRELVRANSWIESSTIVAIVTGTVIGARLADYSTSLALVMVVGLFIISSAITLLIPKLPPRGASKVAALPAFVRMTRGFFATARVRFSMLGASIFWGVAAVLRVILIAWAPIVLMLNNATEISELTLFLAIGIVAGAALVPKLIPMEYLRRARLAAYLMGIFIILLGGVQDVWAARIVLFIIGCAGGLFVVPINAALQKVGHDTIGSGGAVAIQHFFENLAMLFAVGLYTLASTRDVDPTLMILILGFAVLIATTIISWHLPRDPQPGA